MDPGRRPRSSRLLDLVLVVFLWRMVRRRGVTTASKALLLGAIVVLPAIVVFLATAHGMQESMTVNACGDCHAMESHVADLRNPASDSLAAVHYKNRYIQTNQCYTCHSDYGMFGTMSAKLDGLRPRLLQHDGQLSEADQDQEPVLESADVSPATAARRISSPSTKRSRSPNLMADKDSCLDCHGPAHKPEPRAAPEKQAMR